MSRYRLNVEYDGSPFRGWQVQPDAPSVQGAIEAALSTLFGGAELRIIGSGRTDTGVHAIDQVAHVDLPEERETGKLLRGLNSLLPDGIRVWRVAQVDSEFHARYGASERRYAYRVLKRSSTFLGRFGWSVPFLFDPDLAQSASKHLLGSHNFRAFSTRPGDEDSTMCELRNIIWNEDAFGWVIEIVADRFLRRMVRTIVGTLVEIGAGRVEVETLQTLLLQGFGRAGVPAPPQGLALMRVHYDIDEPDDVPGPSLWGEFA